MSNLNLPWVLLGDFNAITSTSEHIGGPYYYYARKAKLFMDFISNNSLLDVGVSGPDFSWCNGRLGQERRWARLDRCLINDNWANNYNAQILYHLPRVSPDHAPLLLIAANNVV